MLLKQEELFQPLVLSTCSGDAFIIVTMKHKKFSNMDFKKLHPAGSLGAQLKTVEDIMITGSKIPFV